MQVIVYYVTTSDDTAHNISTSMIRMQVRRSNNKNDILAQELYELSLRCYKITFFFLQFHGDLGAYKLI